MVTTRDISYEADGRTMIGMLAVPDGNGPRPGILVCHEGPGLDDQQKDAPSAWPASSAMWPSRSTTTATASRSMTANR